MLLLRGNGVHVIHSRCVSWFCLFSSSPFPAFVFFFITPPSQQQHPIMGVQHGHGQAPHGMMAMPLGVQGQHVRGQMPGQVWEFVE